MELLCGKKTGGIPFAWIRLAALGLILSIAIQVGSCESEPTESQCRPYIEKALKEQHIGEGEKSEEEWKLLAEHSSKEENYPTDELTETTEEDEGLKTEESPADDENDEGGDSETKEDETEEETEEDEPKDETESAEQERDDDEDKEEEGELKEQDEEADETESKEHEKEGDEEASQEEAKDEDEEAKGEDEEAKDDDEGHEDEQPEEEEEGEDREEGEDDKKDTSVEAEDESREGETKDDDEEEKEDKEDKEEDDDTQEEKPEEESVEGDEGEATAEEARETEESAETGEAETGEAEEAEGEAEEGKDVDEIIERTMQEILESQAESAEKGEEGEAEAESKTDEEDADKGDEEAGDEAAPEGGDEEDADKEEEKETAETEDGQSAEGDEEQDMTPEEDLTKEVIIPENLRPRDHIIQILRLDEDSVETESILAKAVDTTLKSLKGLYDNAIKPLEMLYKYRDLSNRHFGDPEIFSKPLILFMGPWSGGKSTTINYLLDNEFTEMSLRTGAEPSPAYFNILMYGSEEEVLDGTQLAADWTFSGLQKFGQGLLDRLKGYKLPNRLLEKVNIVEIPGILEIRKQVQRLFPFNDACQWFIDRADIIFLVYDPSKLDVGPETEAILDQLKGREYQTRIILNKADQVKPEELMRVQGTLIWNISPLMSSTEPPVMYTTSLWSLPYESGAPTRLLLAQERAFLRDLRDAIDKRVENKIASARRFAVRVRNHAKMVDCYLTTYYNHKTFFGNKKKISDDIIENPQKYHIYEGLSTLTNISRYDLPDPDVYKDFFRLNALYDFKKLSDTCTYFRGCPINTLDVAIAYDLPELVGKYKKAVESSKGQSTQKTSS